jgi:hypothetical protein
MGESRDGYRVLVGKPEGRRQLARNRRRWKDNIKMDLREVSKLVIDFTICKVCSTCHITRNCFPLLLET